LLNVVDTNKIVLGYGLFVSFFYHVMIRHILHVGCTNSAREIRRGLLGQNRLGVQKLRFGTLTTVDLLQLRIFADDLLLNIVLGLLLAYFVDVPR